MQGRKMRMGWFWGGLTGTILLASACSTGTPGPEGVRGTTRLALAGRTPDGTTYRLEDATFTIAGPEATTLATDPGSDAEFLMIDLGVGAYTISLEEGWRFTRDDPDGTTAEVEATLLSANPAPFSIGEAGVTDVRFRFRVGDDVVETGEGTLRVGVDVETAGCELVGSDGAAVVDLAIATDLDEPESVETSAGTVLVGRAGTGEARAWLLGPDGALRATTSFGAAPVGSLDAAITGEGADERVVVTWVEGASVQGALLEPTDLSVVGSGVLVGAVDGQATLRVASTGDTLALVVASNDEPSRLALFEAASLTSTRVITFGTRTGEVDLGVVGDGFLLAQVMSTDSVLVSLYEPGGSLLFEDVVSGSSGNGARDPKVAEVGGQAFVSWVFATTNQHRLIGLGLDGTVRFTTALPWSTETTGGVQYDMLAYEGQLLVTQIQDGTGTLRATPFDPASNSIGTPRVLTDVGAPAGVTATTSGRRLTVVAAQRDLPARAVYEGCP